MKDYVEFETGKDGFIQRCYTRAFLSFLIDKFPGETFTKELWTDFKHLTTIIKRDDEFPANDMVTDCDQYKETCMNETYFDEKTNFETANFLEHACAKWIRFDQLCELIRARQSVEGRVLVIEKWVCDVSDEAKAIINKQGQSCKAVSRDIISASKREAGDEFYTVIAYTIDDLEKAKQDLAEQDKAEKANDAKVTQETFAAMKEILSDAFSSAKECWAKEEVQVAAKKEKLAEEKRKRMAEGDNKYRRRRW